MEMKTMQRRLRNGIHAALLLALVAAVVPGGVAQAQAATLVLTPSSGDPPSINGNLGGGGWCTPASSVTVSGTGVSGSAQVGRDGTLTGSFSVVGSAGDVVTIAVEAACRAGTSVARAQFHFNVPAPTRAPTRIPAVTWTPTTTASAVPTPTETPAAFALPAAPTTGTVAILVCEPAAADLSIVFIEVGVTPGPPDVGVQPGPPTFVAPVFATADPHLFAFDGPTAPVGTLFALDLEIDSPDCPADWDPPATYGFAGEAIDIQVALPGTSELLASNLGEEAPGLKKEIFAGAWVDQLQTAESPNDYLQLFQWTTDLANALGGELQASILPFPPSSQTSLQPPPGLVETWDVTCVNCQFTIDLSPLAPQPNPLTQPSSQTFFAKLLGAVKVIWGGVQKAWGSAVDLLTGAADVPAPAMAEANLGLPPQDNPTSYMSAGQGAPPLITDYYFRVVPKANGQTAGAATNSVRLRFYADDMNLFPNGIIDCNKYPEACSSPGAPRPYIVEVLSYHGIIHPNPAKYGCYLATKTIKVGPITYLEGDQYCPPEEDEGFSLPGLVEAIVDFVVDAINWASQAYADLKAAVIDFVGGFVPDPPCGNACLTAMLDVGLAALGIPPSVPNFDQLMDQGIEYMASQAVEQIGVPPAVSDLGSLAEEQWKDEMQGHFEDALEEGVQAAQASTWKSVSYIPDGVPVKPHPESGDQPATMLIRVTRDPLVPAEADTCSSSTDPWKATTYWFHRISPRRR
jgi:hypothetical protein